jgi:hypothetical protein
MTDLASMAAHEAGHIVAGAHFSRQVFYVSFRSQNDHGLVGDLLGLAHIAAVQSANTPELMQQNLVILAAGPIAEMCYRQQETIPLSGTDFDDSQRIAREILGPGASPGAIVDQLRVALIMATRIVETRRDAIDDLRFAILVCMQTAIKHGIIMQ